MSIGEGGGFAAAVGALEEADLEKEWLVDCLNGVHFFGNGGGEGVEAHRATAEFFDQGAEKATINFIEDIFINYQ